MSTKFGEIDIDQILINEYRIAVLEGIIDWILTNNTAFTNNLTENELNKIRQGVIAKLQKKYPNSEIHLSSG